MADDSMAFLSEAQVELLADVLDRIVPGGDGLAGAGELARLSEEAPESLRKRVTSPGGTTEAALGVLMADDGLAQVMRRAVAAATRRSRELAG